MREQKYAHGAGGAMEGDARHAGLFRAGAASALIIVAIFAVEMVVVALKGFPPVSVDEWFSAFNDSRGMGLIRTFALDVVAVTLHAPLYLALYFMLKSRDGTYSLLIVSVALAFIGVAVYLASNVTFSMLSIYDRYAAAGTEAQKARLLAAADALLSIYDGTGPFAAYALYSIGGILISVVMLKGPEFGKGTAVIGIIGNALELGLHPSIDPPFFLKVDSFLIAFGGIFVIAWYILIARRLSKKAKSVQSRKGEGEPI